MSEAEADLRDNPLLMAEGLPRFDLIQPAHVVPAVRHVLARALSQVEEAEKSIEPSWEGTVEALDRIGRPFEYAWSPVSHLFGVKNSPELRVAYETVLGDVVAFGLRVKQSKPVYDALASIRDGGEWRKLDEGQRRIISRKLLDMELAGIGLEPAKRERFNAIAQELSQLSTDFSNHVLDATKAWSLVLTSREDVAGLPPSLLQLAAQSYNESEKKEHGEIATAEDGPWRITLEAPSFGPFLQHCRKTELREKAYRAFITRAASGEIDNTPLIPKILKLRQEQAQLLGFATFADMSLSQKMASTVDAVEDMLEKLRQASWETGKSDMKDIEEISRERGEMEPPRHWDIAFWAERLREHRYDFTDEELRPYFPLERVLDGLFSLAQRLFGIIVKQAEEAVPVWHKDVRYFKVFDETGAQIAAFYLDPYSRPADKRGGAWMDDCLSRRVLDEDNRLQLPVAHLVCNSTPPVGERPSLMTFREVETLFHEFGHGLQHMLTIVNYPDAAGINGVEWDAVELPSQFMENWCYHKPTLVGMTRHWETGEPLPDELFEKIRSARNYRSGSNMLRQLLFGLTDIELHGRYNPDGTESPFEVQRRVAEKTSVLPTLPEDRFLCSFQHIFAGGYAAGYYSYKWAEVLSADAFSEFEDAGLDDEAAVAQTGRRFRNTVLALGGSRHPMEIFKDFRGREPSPEALLRHSGLATKAVPE